MIAVLLFSAPEVKAKVFERVRSARRPLIVSQVRQERFARPIEEREPYAAIEDVFGEQVDQLVVADDATPEGMWRDPVGDLADSFFPNDRGRAYAASSGYTLVLKGEVAATVKKSGAPADDLWLLQEALAQHVPGVPPPNPARRPGHPKRADFKAARPGPRPASTGGARKASARSWERPPEPEPGFTPDPEPASAVADPWALLGIPAGTPLADAKRAFRALISQYHPDKVSHLAPEFKELADRRTREILDAWRMIEEDGE